VGKRFAGKKFCGKKIAGYSREKIVKRNKKRNLKKESERII